MTCKFEGCIRRVKCKGLCAAHYNQTARGKPLTPLREHNPRSKICTFEGCDRPTDAKGLCSLHYQQQSRGVELYNPIVHPKICSVEGCDKPYYAKGLCQAHYDRQKVGLPTTITKVCAVIGCDELVANHNAKRCKKHSDEHQAYWKNKIDEDTIRVGTLYD